MNMTRRCLTALLTLVYVVGFVAVPLAGALPADQKAIMDASIYRFDIHQLASCGEGDSGSEAVETSKDVMERAKTAFRYLLEHGSNNKFHPPEYTPKQVAGIVANLMAESGVNPKATEPPPGTGYGIAQWSFGRKPAMRAWVSAQDPPNNNPNELGGQLDYLLHELQTSEANADRGLRKETSIPGAVTVYMNLFERPNSNPAINHIAQRKVNGQAVYDAVKADGGFTEVDPSSGSGDTGDAAGCEGDATSSGSVDCKTATGNAKILCEAQKYKGIYYRWGGGHGSVDAFHAHCPNPSNPPNNHPHGAPPDPSNGNVSGNPSPCATDCSGLVSIAVDEAFGQKFSWNVSALQGDSRNWKKISLSDAKAGDVVTRGDFHVEIVDHMSGSTAFTFGSHETGTKTGPAKGKYSAAYRYTGPGNE